MDTPSLPEQTGTPTRASVEQLALSVLETIEAQRAALQAIGSIALPAPATDDRLPALHQRRVVLQQALIQARCAGDAVSHDLATRLAVADREYQADLAAQVDRLRTHLQALASWQRAAHGYSVPGNLRPAFYVSQQG